MLLTKTQVLVYIDVRKNFLSVTRGPAATTSGMTVTLVNPWNDLPQLRTERGIHNGAGMYQNMLALSGKYIEKVHIPQPEQGHYHPFPHPVIV